LNRLPLDIEFRTEAGMELSQTLEESLKDLAHFQVESKGAQQALPDNPDCVGITQAGTSAKTKIVAHHIDDITVLHVSGRITAGKRSAVFRRIVQDLVKTGHHRILLNLSRVDCIDGAGIGELVRAYVWLHDRGGQLKLACLNQRVRDMLQMTCLDTVFDIQADQEGAIRSFTGR